jgi:hypothetical protein
MATVNCFTCGISMSGGLDNRYHYLCDKCGRFVYEKINWVWAPSHTYEGFSPNGAFEARIKSLLFRCPQCERFHLNETS